MEELKFKMLNEFSEEELKAVSKCKFNMYQVEQRNQVGSYRYSLEAMICPGMTIRFSMDDATFMLLKRAYGVTSSTFSITNRPCYYRLIKGISKNGKEYILAEIMASRYGYFRKFLNVSQISILKDIPDNKDILDGVVVKPENIEISECVPVELD